MEETIQCQNGFKCDNNISFDEAPLCVLIACE